MPERAAMRKQKAGLPMSRVKSMRLGLIMALLVGLTSTGFADVPKAPVDHKASKAKITAQREKLKTGAETKVYTELQTELQRLADYAAGNAAFKVKINGKELNDGFVFRDGTNVQKSYAGVKALVDRLFDFRAGIQEFCWDETKHPHSRGLAKKIDEVVAILHGKFKGVPTDKAEEKTITLNADELAKVKKIQVLMNEYYTERGGASDPKNAVKKVRSAKGYDGNVKEVQIEIDRKARNQVRLFSALSDEFKASAAPPVTWSTIDADYRDLVTKLNATETEACIFVPRPATEESTATSDATSGDGTSDDTGPTSGDPTKSSATGDDKDKDKSTGTGGIPAQPGPGGTPSTPGGTPPVPTDVPVGPPPTGFPDLTGALAPLLDVLGQNNDLASLLPLLANAFDDNDDDEQQAIQPPPPGKAAAAPGASPSSSTPTSSPTGSPTGAVPPPGGDEGQGPPPGGLPPFNPPQMGGQEPFQVAGLGNEGGSDLLDTLALMSLFGQGPYGRTGERGAEPVPPLPPSNPYFNRLATAWQPNFNPAALGWPMPGQQPGWGQPGGFNPNLNYGAQLQQRLQTGVGGSSRIPTIAGSNQVVSGGLQSGNTSATTVPGARVPFDPSARGVSSPRI